MDWFALDRAGRSLGLTALCLGGWLAAGCETTRPAREPPPTAPLAMPDAMRAAGSLRQAQPGRSAVIGQGDSMAPLYGEGAVVVFTPVAFADLEPGMIVGYRNRANRTVVHRLVRREADGWVAHGIANPREDSEKVTAENLIGVVYGVFYTDP